MVRIRLSRKGAKKRPFYHIVAANISSPRDGKFLEKLGYFNPIAAGKDIPFHINKESLDKWVKNGAQMSDRVKVLVKKYSAVAAG
jgi:small subunit ribosomal protein S16